MNAATLDRRSDPGQRCRLDCNRLIEKDRGGRLIRADERD
jgi:hypothetical protein